MNQCYYCGKAIQEDLIIKDVHSTMRCAFHKECWKEHHGKKVRKEALQYGALAVIAFLMVGALPIYFFDTTLGTIVVILSVVVLAFLAVNYYRINK